MRVGIRHAEVAFKGIFSGIEFGHGRIGLIPYDARAVQPDMRKSCGNAKMQLLAIFSHGKMIGVSEVKPGSLDEARIVVVCDQLRLESTWRTAPTLFPVLTSAVNAPVTGAPGNPSNCFL